ncbi:MAG: tetratricopeptide repeat protein [Usitatibacter sp.]
MHSYGVRDVERLIGLTRATLRALIAAGFVTPERGPRNAWRFSFQDLVVLRTAHSLVDAGVSNRRIARSVKELRRHLPESMPLAGLTISAVADRIVVKLKQGGGRWLADTGQYLLEFVDRPVTEINGVGVDFPRRNKPVSDTRFPPGGTAESGPGYFEQGLELEERDAKAALQAYARAIAADPAHLDARINMALLLHEAKRYAEAERAYLAALDACGADAVLLFNFAVLLDDMGHVPQAIRAYQAAVQVDPEMADAHYNLALLHEQAGRGKDAIRHMSQYRRLRR